jgi:hypothetical protein
MSDTAKSCLGFFFLFSAITLAVLGVFSGGLGSLISWLGGESYGINLRTGSMIGIGAFAFFFVLSIYSFIKIKNWAWFPAIFGALYAVLPDIILGPEDDIGIVLLGAAISGIITWRQNKKLEANLHK